MTLLQQSSPAPILLGIDLGTQGLKVIAFDAGSASLIGSASAPVNSLSSAPGWLEQDPKAWWVSLCRVTRQLIAELDISSEAIAAIGLSGHMHSIVSLDAKGDAVHHCIVWADTRSQAQARQVADLGLPLWNPSIAPYSLNKILWLRENRPDVFAKVERFVFSKDYLRFRMTGAFATDYADASGSLLWDFANWRWDAELLTALDLAPSLLPEARQSCDAAGRLTDEAAAEMGLAPGTVVAVGGGDCACAVVGAGIPDANTLLINAGTAVQVIEMRQEPAPFPRDGDARYLFALGVGRGVFAIGALNSAGHALEWWRRTLDAKMSYADFDALAAKTQPTPDGPIFLPWLQGSGTPHLLDGAHGSFIGMSASSDKSQLTRAVMEGVAFGIKHCAEALVGSGGLDSRQIIFSGGLPRSPVMRQILADVFGASLRFRRFSDLSALGAAAHGAVAAGLADDAEAWLAGFDYGERAQDANAESADMYSRIYERYKRFASRVAGSDSN